MPGSSFGGSDSSQPDARRHDAVCRPLCLHASTAIPLPALAGWEVRPACVSRCAHWAQRAGSRTTPSFGCFLNRPFHVFGTARVPDGSSISQRRLHGRGRSHAQTPHDDDPVGLAIERMPRRPPADPRPSNRATFVARLADASTRRDVMRLVPGSARLVRFRFQRFRDWESGHARPAPSANAIRSRPRVKTTQPRQRFRPAATGKQQPLSIRAAVSPHLRQLLEREAGCDERCPRGPGALANSSCPVHAEVGRADVGRRYPSKAPLAGRAVDRVDPADLRSRSIRLRCPEEPHAATSSDSAS